MREAWLWWSSGKDSAWALRELRRGGEFEVTRLVTTFRAAGAGAGGDRVAMHEVPRIWVEAQARAAGLPLRAVELPASPSNEVYEASIAPIFDEARAGGVEAMVFGDLFLEDIRAYRQRLLAPTGLEAVFPLWGCATAALAREMLSAGLRASVVSVDLAVLDSSFAGRSYDRAFLDALPAQIDPCGENGEFHTFVTAGPMFDAPLAVGVGSGPPVRRGGLACAELQSTAP